MRCPCVKRPVWVLVKQCVDDVMIDGAVGDPVLPAVPDDAARAAGYARGVGDGRVLGFGRRCTGWRAMRRIGDPSNITDTRMVHQ
jgi:hypothetical protein